MLRSLSGRIIHRSVWSLVGVLPGLSAEGYAHCWHICTTGSISSSFPHAARAVTTKPQGMSIHELQHPHEMQQQEQEQGLQDTKPHPQHHQQSQQHDSHAEYFPTEALQMGCGDQMEQAGAASTNALRDVLEVEQVSFPAVMSALRCNSRQPLQPDVVVSNIRALKGFFGADMVNKMVAAAPLVLQRRPDTLKAHYDGLHDVLGGNDRLLHDIITRVPDILNHAPTTVQGRITELCTIFQVDEQHILRLVKKAPVLLRRESSRVAACVQYLQEVSGLPSKEVFKLFLSWPLMATSSKELLTTRYQAVQAVLEATPADMQRICSVYPSILVRDPSQLAINIASIAQQLQLPLEEVVAITSKNAGLLSWNVSTLLSRVTIICQTLRLPPELRASLLTHNKTLLTHHADIPERVEHLKKLLGLQEAELLPLLHSKLTVLRLPVELMEGKMVLVNSLALLHPAWTADLQDLLPQTKLQLLQAGESRFWRMVYLVHTGQQGCGSIKRHLTASRATFDKLFTRFRWWLDRYNHVVASDSIPLVPPFAPDGGQGPAHYTPVTSDSSLGRRPVGQRVLLPDTHAALATHNTTPCSHSSTGSAALLPPAPADILAAWWGVGLDDAQDFLSKLWRQYSWHEWQQRLSALEDLMAVLGWLPQQSSGTASNSSGGSSGQGGSTAISPAAAGSPLLPVAAAAAAGAEAADEAHQQAKPAAHRRRRRQLQPPLQCFMLRQEAQEALQHAMSSSHAAAVAAVSVACHLAPFSKQLHQLAPKPPDLVVKFALQHPAVISKTAFVAICNTLAVLAAESDFLRHQMRSLDLAGLSRCLKASATHVKNVQYLVVTQQPIPWVYNLSQLLMQQRFTSKSRGSRRAEFVAAYPGYEAWEKVMHEL